MLRQLSFAHYRVNLVFPMTAWLVVDQGGLPYVSSILSDSYIFLHTWVKFEGEEYLCRYDTVRVGVVWVSQFLCLGIHHFHCHTKYVLYYMLHVITHIMCDNGKSILIWFRPPFWQLTPPLERCPIPGIPWRDGASSHACIHSTLRQDVRERVLSLESVLFGMIRECVFKRGYVPLFA